MADLTTRPFSKDYSGLSNQTIIGVVIVLLCVTGQELMKRKRRGRQQQSGEGLGSRESWEFAYLYQGRSWARNPSPPSPAGGPLSWVKQAIAFPEDKLNELRGIDATLYVRFLRGCFWFGLLHSLTTFPILFPIHVRFSDDAIPSKSMRRASISSLVGTAKGISLLWIHVCLLFWITFTWIGVLLWVCKGVFRLRAANLDAASKRAEAHEPIEDDRRYYPHPHPQYGFADVPELDVDHPNTGLRLRTVMVANLPPALRNEKVLKEYFESYMSRKLEKPSMGITSSTQPGFLNKSFAFLFNRAKRIPVHLPNNPLMPHSEDDTKSSVGKPNTIASTRNSDNIPVIERVVVARKMTELASLLERREEILRLLETAHIKLANKTLLAVKAAMDRRDVNKPIGHSTSRAAEVAKQRRSIVVDPECCEPLEETLDEEERMQQLIETLGPFVEEFGLRSLQSALPRHSTSKLAKHPFWRLRTDGSNLPDSSTTSTYPPVSAADPSSPNHNITIWEALLSLPRSSLDAYQPLINLSHLFHGQTVPSIDYYTAKLGLVASMIKGNREKPIKEYDPVSTAFVTFADPADARKACKYLAVHPKNPLACLVTMAPMYQDLDWIRVMKSSYNAEFVKDWVVSIGVWAFTLFWLFPVSLLVGLVSIQNISAFWPSLKAYLDDHAWEEEIIQSFIPTILVALLALLIPLILLLIAKKAHTITTLSGLHDRIMTRYYKFLIVNVLVFFCVGTAVLQSFLESFRSNKTTRPDVLKVVADSFPTAGPFYVGWLIFTMAMHNGFEIVLLGLPLIMYPSTSRQVTPRKRAVGIRPRTFNFYYWLPNHLLVMHVLLLFSILNPFVIPFGTIYFFIAAGVVKNQLIHVYAKHYEANGQVILIRIVRYSLDGLILSQAVFLAYMVVLKKTANVGLAAFLIVFTAIVKLLITRMCRAQFELDDIAEAEILCGHGLRRSDSGSSESDNEDQGNGTSEDVNRLISGRRSHASIFTWRIPAWATFSYSSVRHRPLHPRRRQQNPFGPEHTQPQSVRETPSRDITDPSLEEYPWGSPPFMSQTGGDGLLVRTEPTRMVVAHPPPVAWDDQTTVDLPYDNPFYTRAISNVLWLPRDPCGILNLDDTVDFKTSLTVVESAGELGVWKGLPETESPMEMDRPPSALLASPKQNPVLSNLSLPLVDGTEAIDLPFAIAKRVQAKENDVEQTRRPRRPSTYRGRLSGEKGTLGRRRPTILEPPPLLSYRSFSDGTVQSRERSSSIMSALQTPPRLVRARSTDHELGLRPDVHAQADLVAANASTSRVSLNPPRLTRAQNVSTHQAILHEVVAEESNALASRIEEEQAEADKSRTTKSWLTSWMFKKSS